MRINNLPKVEPTDSYVEGWARAFEQNDSATGKIQALAAALDNMGERGLRLVLKRLKCDDGAELVKRCHGQVS